MILKLQMKVFVMWTTLWLSVTGSATDSDGEKREVHVTADTGLICSDEGLLPSALTWAKHGSIKSLRNDTMEAQNETKTPILNMTAEHFGGYICAAQHQNNTLTEVDITVIYVKKPDISFNTTTTAVEAAGALNLTCVADSLHPSVTTWTQINSVLQNVSRSVTVTIQDARANYSGPYTCTSKPMNNTGDKDEVVPTVNSISQLEITGQTSVKEGEMLNLTCTAKGTFLITWTKVGSTKNWSSRTHSRVKNSATLFISHVTTEDSGRYMCGAEHLNTTVTANVSVTVILQPKMENSSGCRYQLEILTCMCISQDDPVPTIRWPLLDKHSSYIITNTVVNNTVNSTFILSEKDHNNTAVQCVLSNAYWEVKKQLLIKHKGEEEKNKEDKEEEDLNEKILKRILQLEITLAFLVGILLSACICCLTRKCCRKNQKHSGYVTETLEMVTSQQDPLVPFQVVPESAEEHSHTHYHPEGEAGDAAKSDVEYSNINLSVLSRNGAMAAEHVQNTTNTEYSEIKKHKRRQERHDGEAEEMTGEEETHQHPTEEDNEDAALYSTVKDVMEKM